MSATREIARFVTPPHECSYLPQETASLEYRVLVSLPVEQYAAMLERGWRRHGARFFRPQCPSCRQCRSLRVDVAKFAPTKSQRRVFRRNSDMQVVVQPPSITPDHIRLFNDYHADMSRRRGWSPHPTTAEEYHASFLIGNWSFAREMLYFRAGRLAGVGLVDVLPDAVSSVYFYHDPAWRPLAPGTFSILSEIEFCRETGRTYNYLGYWIEPCASMAYKANFGPHEVLESYVEADEAPLWKLL
jgi:arginyl-tRNA--protein-N-Asp/Glu arginylyltransferase